MASASSSNDTVSSIPLQRSTYRLVSSATLTARGPRRLDPVPRVPSRLPYRASTYRRCHADRVAFAAPGHAGALGQSVDRGFIETLARSPSAMAKSVVDRSRNSRIVYCMQQYRHCMHSMQAPGSCRIHGELGKLGIAVSERTVSRLLTVDSIVTSGDVFARRGRTWTPCVAQGESCSSRRRLGRHRRRPAAILAKDSPS